MGERDNCLKEDTIGKISWLDRGMLLPVPKPLYWETVRASARANIYTIRCRVAEELVALRKTVSFLFTFDCSELSSMESTTAQLMNIWHFALNFLRYGTCDIASHRKHFRSLSTPLAKTST